MNILKLNNSSQLIEEEWLELVKKYFPNENINLLKVGLFGYLNEIMSNEIKNNIYHRNFIYDEYLLNTASTRKAIYNFAKLYDVEMGNAIPAKVSVTLSVRESDLVKENFQPNTIAENGNIQKSIISRDTEFSLNGKTFLLPYDIQIVFNRNIVNDNKYVVTAEYLNNNDFPYLDINNNILKTWDTVYNGDRYIYIKADLFQLRKNTIDTMIASENTLYNTFYEYSFSDQLAFFKVYYIENDIKEELDVFHSSSIYYNSGKKCCYYTLTDNNRFEISFIKSNNGFRPVFGSRLIVEIYTTEGAKGNLGAISGISTSYNISDFESSTPILVSPLSDCYGGVNSLSLLELKSRIVNKNLIRNAIVTEKDLDYFFNTIKSSELVNNSEMRFIKKRNDVLRKVYSIYCLLKDTNSSVIPTRTIDKLNISSNQIKELVGPNANNITIPERSLIVYDMEASNYFLITKELEMKRYIDNEKYLVYSIPYLLNINTNEFLSCKYYKTYMNKDINLEYRYNNPQIPYKFLLNGFNISKNSLDSDNYKLSLTLNTNLATSSDILDNIKIRGILKNNSGTAYGYFDFNRNSIDNLLYEAELATEKYNTINNGKLNLYNSVYLISTKPIMNEDGSTSLKNCYIDEDVTLEIQVLFRSEYSSFKYGEAASMPDLILADGTQFASACVFYSSDLVGFFKDMSKFIDSTVSPIGDLSRLLNSSNSNNIDSSNTVENTGITVQSIPVIEHNYFKNNTIQVYRILENFKILLDSNINRLEPDMELDLKLFNSHGPSKMLYTGIEYVSLSGNKNYRYLDRLDIHLDITIYLNKYISDEVKEEVNEFLAKYIESLNEKGVIAISNICKTLEQNFEFINFIEFNGINGKQIQKIMSLEYDNDINYNFVPEYVNVRKGVTTIESSTNEKKYKYALTINYK